MCVYVKNRSTEEHLLRVMFGGDASRSILLRPAASVVLSPVISQSLGVSLRSEKGLCEFEYGVVLVGKNHSSIRTFS